jgi:hypothetical protein
MAAPAVVAVTPELELEEAKQLRIKEAIERAKALAATEQPRNTDTLTAEQLAEIAAIEARRAKIRELAADSGADDEPPKPY